MAVSCEDVRSEAGYTGVGLGVLDAGWACGMTVLQAGGRQVCWCPLHDHRCEYDWALLHLPVMISIL
jgi:hypothetical protein